MSSPSLIALALGCGRSLCACVSIAFLLLLVLLVIIGSQVYWVFPHLTTPCYLFDTSAAPDAVRRTPAKISRERDRKCMCPAMRAVRNLSPNLMPRRKQALGLELYWAFPVHHNE